MTKTTDLSEKKSPPLTRTFLNKVLRALREPLRIAEIADKCRGDKKTVKKALVILTREKMVHARGERRARRYFLAV